MFVSTAYALSATAASETATPATTDEVHTETGVAHDAGHAEVFPPFDATHYPSQLLWLAITFGVFYFLIAKLISPRIGNIIATREARIEGDLAEANRMKNEADAAVAKYEQELAIARAKGQAIAAEARDAAKLKADKERAALEADLAGKISQAEQSIAAIKDKALAEVETVAEETATEIVSALTGVTVNKTDAAQAVKAVKA